MAWVPATPVHMMPNSSSLPCVFQGALLARSAVCELVSRCALAEREELACSVPTAHINCETLAKLFHERATFPLRLHPGGLMTHAIEMRLQCGGLHGLQNVLDVPQADVHKMVRLAQAKHGSLTDLPWMQIVESILAWQPRRRSDPKLP